MKRILIVKTSSLGDVVHNLPVASDIRRRFPDAHIDWVVEEPYTPLVRLHSAVRRVIPVALRRWRRTPGGSTAPRGRAGGGVEVPARRLHEPEQDDHRGHLPDQKDADHYKRIWAQTTAPGARTSLYVADLGILYVAVPGKDNQKAEVRAYKPKPPEK